MKTNWQIKKLGEISTIQTGKWDANHAIKSGKYRFYTCAYKHLFCDTKRFSGECLILPGNGVNVGEIFYHHGDFDAYQRTYVINNIKIFPKFLYYHLLCFWKDRNLNKQFGSATNFLKIGNFSNYEIFYPESLLEQKRIARTLDDVFNRITKAKENIEKNLQNAKELSESYLQNVFISPGKNWKEKTLEDVCKKLFAGGDVPRDNFSKEKNKKFKIPIIANAVKGNGLYGFTDSARVNEPSITIAARGSGTGHTEIRNESFFPIVRLIVLIPNLSVISLEFLKYSIDTLRILRSGSAIPQLTIPMIKGYGILLPSLFEQKVIIKKLDALFAKTKRLEEIYKQKLADLEELKKSVLAKAFAGEL